MKLEEINKLLNMLDANDLISLRKYLLDEKKEIKQKVFEKYLTDSIIDINRIPRLCLDGKKQKFTNGVSLYIINYKYFDTNTNKLNINKNTTYDHRFLIESNNKFSNYLNSILFNYGCIDKEVILKNIKQYSYALHKDSDDIFQGRFNKKEIEMADILLDNPTYKISSNMPILKAESKMGKAYILGYKWKEIKHDKK